MHNLNVIGKSVPRKESLDKVAGAARYTDNYDIPGLLHARMVISPYAHAKIKFIEYANALKASGVRAVLTGQYKIIDEAFPEANTNIANRTKIRKGDIKKGWAKSEVTVEASFSFPPSDHAAMETRCVRAEILPEGKVIIYSASQAPFVIKKLISYFFKVDPGKEKM